MFAPLVIGPAARSLSLSLLRARLLTISCGGLFLPSSVVRCLRPSFAWASPEKSELLTFVGHRPPLQLLFRPPPAIWTPNFREIDALELRLVLSPAIGSESLSVGLFLPPFVDPRAGFSPRQLLPPRWFVMLSPPSFVVSYCSKLLPFALCICCVCLLMFGCGNSVGGAGGGGCRPCYSVGCCVG